MNNLTYDLDKVCRAMDAIIDQHWGAVRVERIYRALEKPNGTVRLRPEFSDCQELVRIGRQNRKVLDALVKYAEQKRAETYEGVHSAEELARIRLLSQIDRDMCSIVVQIEETKRGRKLTADERKEEIARRRRIWKNIKKAKYASNTLYPNKMAVYDAANEEILSNLKAELLRAKARGKVT